MTALSSTLLGLQSKNRAALIGYIPAGFPSKSGCLRIIDALIEGGIDALEIGFPYSDPVMDGPTIQEASVKSLAQGTSARDVLDAAAYGAARVPTVVMSYWNPIERFGVARFATELAARGGSGVITPDLTIEESSAWQAATQESGVDSIYVVAPSTSDERLDAVSSACRGFVYAASLMGVTGARTDISDSARTLVGRLRSVTKTPICVGLGVSTREQARDVASFADGVIVGSAFVKEILASSNEDEAAQRVRAKAEELAKGVREAR